MKKALTYLFIFTVFVACTKEELPPTPPQEEPKEEPTEEPTPVPKDSITEYYYAEKSYANRRSTHYLDSDVSPALFLGSIQHLKDTSNNVSFAPLSYNLTGFEVFMFSPQFSSESVAPSYEQMRNFAQKHHAVAQTNSYSFQRSTFTDYTEIKRWVPDNVDVANFLQLATVSDSTVIRKPTGVVLRSEAVAFSFTVDLVSVYEEMLPHIDAIRATGQSPYIIADVSYGKHSIIMTESDSTYAQVHTALEKLLEDKTLEEVDEYTLATSKVLIYFRGGGKESFVQRAEGMQAIKSLIGSYNKERLREDNLYDYPLYYLASNLHDNSVLRYNYSFNFLQKEERRVEKQ